MESSEPDSRTRFLLSQLMSIQTSIRKLEARKLEMEDLILHDLFKPPGSISRQAALSSDIRMLSLLPVRRSPVDCPHYAGWAVRPGEIAGVDAEVVNLPPVDDDGHLVVVRNEAATVHPMADVTVVVHPDMDKEGAVALIQKIAAELQREGLPARPEEMHAEFPRERAPISELPEFAEVEENHEQAPGTSPAEKGPTRTSLAGKLADALAGCFVAAEANVIGLADKIQVSLRHELDLLHGDIDGLTSLLTEQESATSAARESCERLEQSVKSLERAESERRGAVGAVEDGLQQLREQMQALISQSGRQEEVIAGCRKSIEQIALRLERHAGVIRSIHEKQTIQAETSRQLQEAIRTLGMEG